MRFDEEERLEEMRTENAEEVMDGVEEVRSGRGRVGLVRGGEDRYRVDETRKGKGKGNGGKGEHEGKGGGVGRKGIQQVENLVMDEIQENTRVMKSEEKEEDHREDVRKLVEMMQKEDEEQEEQRGRVAPNMVAGGSHPQAMSVPERRETRGMRWADCEDDERQEEEEREQETEKERRQETGQEELTSENPPGLEQKEDERKEEKEKRAQEAREDAERRAQEARERSRGERMRREKKRGEREEQRRAQEAQEQRKAQEKQEREAKAQEERENGVKAQEEQNKEVSAEFMGTSSTHSSMSVGLVETLLPRPLTTAAPHTTMFPGTAARPVSTTTFTFLTDSYRFYSEATSLENHHPSVEKRLYHVLKTIKDTADHERGVQPHIRVVRVFSILHTVLERQSCLLNKQQATSHRR